jgi:diguanylate cyclase (GGDEF)-like protein
VPVATNLLSQFLIIGPSLIIVAAPIEQCRVTASPERPDACLKYRPRKPSALPYLALAAGYSMLITAAVRAGLYPWLGLVFAALVMTLGVTVRQVIALRENYELVVKDNLTGLANRVQLNNAVERALDHSLRNAKPTAVLAIDLNDFKKVNDTYGHDTGDALLVTFAQVLRSAVRETDTAARLGGDEFVVILDQIRDVPVAVTVAERILADAGRPRTINGHSIEIRASIGIALSDPVDTDLGIDELMRRADQAMYTAKRRFRNGWHVYDESDPKKGRAGHDTAREPAASSR